MKIIRKPIIKPVTCSLCYCVFQPKIRNLIALDFQFEKKACMCPVCKHINLIEFEKESEDTK